MKEANNNIPQHWRWAKISELCNVVRGGSPRPAGDPKYYDGSIPFLKVRDLTKDNNTYLTTFEYTIKEAGLHKTRKIAPNTLLLSNSGATLGVPKICMIDATMNDGIAAFLDLDKRSNLYLYYFWLSKTRELRNINMGAAQPNLNTDIIKNYLIPLPPLPEQVAIVNKIEELFSELENGKEQLLTAQRQLKIYRQSLLKAAFEGKLSRDSEKKSGLGFIGLKDDRIKEKSNNNNILKSYNPMNPNADSDLPEGWKWVKLEEVADKITDGEHFRPKTHEKGIPFLSAKDVRDEGVSFDDPLYIDEATAKKAMQRCNPQRGDILIVSRGATVGRMCIVNTDRAFCLLGSVILIKVKETVNSKLLNYILKSPIPNRKLVGVSGATAQQAIYLRDIKSIEIPVPPLPVQQAIVEILESKLTVCDKLEETISHSLQQTETLRQSILKKAFEGKLYLD